MIDIDEVLKKAKSGDSDSVDLILNEYKNLVKAIARRYYLLGGDGDDLVQEGMIGLFKAINSYEFDKNTTFKNYAIRIIERDIISAIRKANSNNNQILDESLEIMDNLGEDRSPEVDVISEENINEIMSEIESHLSVFEREVVKYYLKGYNYIDIAGLMGKSSKSIDNALFRIKNKLSYLRERL